MDPSSDDEILPSPFTSNFLNTCSSSAICSAVLFSDVERDGNEFVVVVAVVVDELLAESDFFFRWKRDLKPMILEEKKKKLFLFSK